jgi:hypothetical protein
MQAAGTYVGNWLKSATGTANNPIVLRRANFLDSNVCGYQSVSWSTSKMPRPCSFNVAERLTAVVVLPLAADLVDSCNGPQGVP